MLRVFCAGVVAANICDPIEIFGTEEVLWDGGVVFKGGGVTPSELIGSGEPCKDSVATSCFSPSCCDEPFAWRLLVVASAVFAAMAMVIAETWIVLGVVVV